MEGSSITDQQARAKRLRQLLTLSQKNDIKQAFDYFDQGGIGKIKKKELKVILRALGFNPTNEELDRLVDVNNEGTGCDTIDFQEFMDIMLTKIEEKLSKDDIKYAFKKISNIIKESDGEFITCEDIEKVAENLDEKLTKEEIEEMLSEAIAAGRLLTKEKEIENDNKINKKNKKKDDKSEVKADIKKPQIHETFEDELIKPVSGPKKINLHEFKAILTWENN
jgi:centrin-1